MKTVSKVLPASLIAISLEAFGGITAAPIPEPNIVALMGIGGVIGLLVYMIKKK